ncbi:MAG: MATE family efflux transporter [Christensenellales bacterium]|nr:MATE family efflux transporter [Christensenellales bacterium]
MTQRQEQKFQYMTNEKVQPLVCRLAIPTILSMLVTSFYNMADTFFVGRIDTSASAAVGVVFSLMAVLQAIGFFFGHGSGNYIARALGRHDYDDARRMASIGFYSALIAGGVIMLLGLIFLEPLAHLLGSTKTILPYSMDYMRFILIGAPYMTASLVLNNQLRFQGNAVYAMAGIIAGAVINIALDPLLIFTFGMGISGAALATIISQFVSFLLLLVGMQRGSTISVHPKDFKPNRHLFLSIFKGGLPSLLRQGLGSAATVCLNFSAGLYGDAAIAGMSIVTRIMQFAYSSLIGFGQGFQPVCGFNYGAKLYHRVKEAFWFCVRLSSIVLVALAVVCFIFAPQIVALFRNDPAVIEVGAIVLRFQSLSFPLAAWLVMCNMMTQTMGKAVRASVLAISRQGLFFLPAVLILPRFFGIFGLEISQTLADVISFAVSIPMQTSLLREMTLEEQQLKASAQDP